MNDNSIPQLASAVLMIRPVQFQTNDDTAASNYFQGNSDKSPEEQQTAALQEFDELKRVLETAGVRVICIDDTKEPYTPDSIFPNNWVSFHADGSVVLYPMEGENRRAERRQDILDTLQSEHGYKINEVFDLTSSEGVGRYLEGTGSMVLDRKNRVAYACKSSRTHIDPLKEFARCMNFEFILFDALDNNGKPIYHTNVMMNVGETLAVICDDAIADVAQRAKVLDSLKQTGHEVVSLSYEQMDAFAGNMLELNTESGRRVLVMSTQAQKSLKPKQIAVIAQNSNILSSPIDEIEAAGGGSVRCMLAEIHLPLSD